jgi:hypothetical protein
VGQVTEPAALLTLVQAYLAVEVAAEEATSTRSDNDELAPAEWRADAAHVWKPVLISHYVGRQLIVTGMVVLAIATSAVLVQPANTVAAISQFYFDKGATSLVMLAD